MGDKDVATGVKTDADCGRGGRGGGLHDIARGQGDVSGGSGAAGGELVTVSYRSGRRAIARMEDAASVADGGSGWGSRDGAMARQGDAAGGTIDDRL